MAIFQIFPKHHSRQFNIPNRYYDPVKAESKQREARIKRELGIVDEEEGTANYKSEISGAFRSRLNPRFNKQNNKSSSTVRVLLIAFILIMGTLLYIKLN